MQGPSTIECYYQIYTLIYCHLSLDYLNKINYKIIIGPIQFKTSLKSIAGH